MEILGTEVKSSVLQLPRILLKKYDIPVVYLDTNILIEMSRCQQGISTSTHKKEIEAVFSILTEKMEKGRVLCPIGNQLQEMGMSRGRITGRDFLYSFTNSELLPPCIIEQIQFDMGYNAFLERKETIEMPAPAFFDSNTFSNSKFVVHAAPIYDQKTLFKLSELKKKSVSILNDMKSAGKRENSFEEQLATELSADSQLFIDALINPYESEDSLTRYLDMIGPVYSRTGITPDTSPDEHCAKLAQYYCFLNSSYHHNIPYVQINASLWAYRMQITNKICDGDKLDTMWAASYLPFVDYAITDIAFCKLLHDLELPKQYDAKVYSFRNLEQFLNDISNI